MRKLYLYLLLSLGWCGIAGATPTGRYVANGDIKVEVLMGKTVAGTMLLKKGRQFQVTGADGDFIQIELGQELKGRLPRAEDTKIALASAENSQVTSQVTTVPDTNTPPQVKSPEFTSTKPEGALAIKGVYIGMDAEEAVRVLNANKPLALKVTYIYTSGEAVKYAIGYNRSNPPRDGEWIFGGELYANLKTRKVTSFSIGNSLSDELFKTADLSATSFATKFINNYGIPELKPVTIQGDSAWHYESPYGWSIYVFGGKGIELFKTPTRQFD